MKKDELRKEYRSLRMALSINEVSEKSHAIGKTIADRFLEGIGSVHVFLPIAKNNEPDLWSLIEFLHESRPDISVVTSVSHAENRNMQHYLLEKDTVLELNEFKIPQPVGAKAFDPKKIDMVLVPLLAYDATGARVGYGKGYYDKFLASIPEALRVGISFFPPSENIEDAEEHDVRLDCCVFPEAVCFFED